MIPIFYSILAYAGAAVATGWSSEKVIYAIIALFDKGQQAPLIKVQALSLLLVVMTLCVAFLVWLEQRYAVKLNYAIAAFISFAGTVAIPLFEQDKGISDWARVICTLVGTGSILKQMKDFNGA